MSAELRDRFVGCLLGGAIGDALGAGIEFDTLAAIRAAHGPNGVTGYVRAYGGLGRITDDTQMTLFTAEGLLCAATGERTEDADVEAIRRAYLRWLATQSAGRRGRHAAGEAEPWLRTVAELNSARAPGNTCLSALHAGGGGTPQAAINNSKGCGGVMRVAPIGLVSATPFATAARAAALTHGHPSGYLSAGAFAAIVHHVSRGGALQAGIDAALAELQTWPGHQETTAAITSALRLANEATAPAPERVEQLGGGWIGEEALAIALYCLLAESDPHAALLLAVNHSGDSDSTGALVGNVVGARGGTAALPGRWLDQLELRDVITTVGNDLADVFVDGSPPDPQRYSCDAGSNSIDTEFMQ